MSVEADLTTLLKTLCPRVFPVVAPAGTALPYVTYSAIGGQSLRFIEGTAADKRNTIMQINVWDATQSGALSLIRQIEDAMCASVVFTAQPEDEPMWPYDAAASRYGCSQDFSIYSTR